MAGRGGKEGEEDGWKMDETHPVIERHTDSIVEYALEVTQKIRVDKVASLLEVVVDVGVRFRVVEVDSDGSLYGRLVEVVDEISWWCRVVEGMTDVVDAAVAFIIVWTLDLEEDNVSKAAVFRHTEWWDKHCLDTYFRLLYIWLDQRTCSGSPDSKWKSGQDSRWSCSKQTWHSCRRCRCKP